MLVKTFSTEGRQFCFDHSNICEVNYRMDAQLDTTILLSNGSVALCNYEVGDVEMQIRVGLESELGLIYIE
jgi:hypothetical protein